MSADLKERLRRLAGGAAASSSPAEKAAPAISVAAETRRPQWIDDLDGVDEADQDAESEGLVDEDEDADSDIPEETHRQPVTNFQPTEPKPEDMTGVPGDGSFAKAVEKMITDDFAKKVADRVVFLIRDALNHLPL